MKFRAWKFAPAFLVCAVALWALVATQPSAPPSPASLLPDGALLYLQATDFHSLLERWNQSPEKRSWLSSDNYAVFSQSRLFGRLSQAQDEFSAAAGISVGSNLLETIAGQQSALGLYDIGNLGFVYLTRMNQAAIEATPLWQTRSKFEQRSEAGTPFYVRVDPQSKRVAAFAASNGWLILGTREDLVAGVLDRVNGTAASSLANESWFLAALGKAPAQPGDLRMVLDLTKIVPSPYFRSYWVQQNITQMKQYASAVSDLYCASSAWREQRVLLRSSAGAAAPPSNVSSLMALVPARTAFWSARSAPAMPALMASLRGDMLDPQPTASPGIELAPPTAAVANAGSATDFETRIDQAPAVQAETHPWQPLHDLVVAAQPTGILTAYDIGPPRTGVFFPIQRAMVLAAQQNWNDAAVRQAIAQALSPVLTVSGLGLQWQQRSGAAGDYYALNGLVPLFAAVRGPRLFLSNDSDLLEQLLANNGKSAGSSGAAVTYAAAFDHSPAQQAAFRTITGLLDRAGNSGSQDDGASPPAGQSPAFFSGNIASLSRVFATVSQETIEEQDHGATVTQTVHYLWAH